MQLGLQELYFPVYQLPVAVDGQASPVPQTPSYQTPTDLCLTDLDRILAEERDPGAHHYLVLGTVPIKE